MSKSYKCENMKCRFFNVIFILTKTTWNVWQYIWKEQIFFYFHKSLSPTVQTVSFLGVVFLYAARNKFTWNLCFYHLFRNQFLLKIHFTVSSWRVVCAEDKHILSLPPLLLNFPSVFAGVAASTKTHCCEIQGKKNCIYHRQIVASSSTLCPSSLSTIPADKVEVLGASANTVKGKGLCTEVCFAKENLQQKL